MIHGLRSAIYFVADIEKAKSWYTDLLGLQPYFDSPYYVGFTVGGFELGLHPASDQTKAGDSVIAYWAVENAHEAFDKLLEKGCASHDKVQDVGEGILIGSVKDPFGNIFGIIQNPNFKYEG